jgi:beta-phosphoglucomutase-like phosphatase (HAD superfamily)
MSGFRGAIFDVDGVLVDSPHEQAWRESLRELMEGRWADIATATSYSPEAFTPVLYHDRMSGKPRLAGARAALEYFGVPEIERRTEEYGAHKQALITRLISEGRFSAYDDALRFVLAVSDAGIPVASASSSKNAGLFLSRVRLDTVTAEQGLPYGWVADGLTLAGLFDVDVSGRDFARGKPDPEIFWTAAAELQVAAEDCFVVEDAVNGVQAAAAGGFGALAVSRAGDTDRLAAAGAELVVTSLDEVDLGGLATRQLRRHPLEAS